MPSASNAREHHRGHRVFCAQHVGCVPPRLPESRSGETSARTPDLHSFPPIQMCSGSSSSSRMDVLVRNGTWSTPGQLGILGRAPTLRNTCLVTSTSSPTRIRSGFRTGRSVDKGAALHTPEPRFGRDRELATMASFLPSLAADRLELIPARCHTRCHAPRCMRPWRWRPSL